MSGMRLGIIATANAHHIDEVSARYRANHRPPPAIAAPKVDEGPKPLKPEALTRPPIGELSAPDHSYLNHNEYKAVADAAKRKRIRLWPDYD